MLDRELTKIERKIMKVIWNSDHKMGLSEIKNAVNETFDANWKPQTISTYLAHLIGKGWLIMERQGRLFLYTPLHTERKFFEKEMNELIEYHCVTNFTDILSVLDPNTITKEEIAKMKELLK